MSDFLEAIRTWNQKRISFIEQNLKKEKPKIAERVQILITVPKGMEQEFKDLAKLRRKQADELQALDTENETALGLAFERDNPPPRRGDYE